MELTKNAYAKINLSLDLTSVLPNGYHAINTVMAGIDLHDTVTVSSGNGGITLSCSEAGVPTDRKNTAYAAAEYFFDETGISPDAYIRIEKRIPSQSGLGGGSSDAAATLKMLNEMHGFPLDVEKLLKIALKTGADVPFMVEGGMALCLNFGEVLAPLPQFDAFVTVAKPGRGVSTKEAYARFDGGIKLFHPDNDLVLYHFARGEQGEALNHSLNVFEQLCSIPEGKEIKNVMKKNGAYYTSLSGSGSAYFGLFESKEGAEKAAMELKNSVSFVYSGRLI